MSRRRSSPTNTATQGRQSGHRLRAVGPARQPCATRVDRARRRPGLDSRSLRRSAIRAPGRTRWWRGCDAARAVAERLGVPLSALAISEVGAPSRGRRAGSTPMASSVTAPCSSGPMAASASASRPVPSPIPGSRSLERSSASSVARRPGPEPASSSSRAKGRVSPDMAVRAAARVAPGGALVSIAAMTTTRTAAAAIIGGGVTGASTAFHLTQRGVRDVVVVDKGTVASGGTGRARRACGSTTPPPRRAG